MCVCVYVCMIMYVCKYMICIYDICICIYIYIFIDVDMVLPDDSTCPSLSCNRTTAALLLQDHPSHALNTHPTLRRNHLEPLGNRKDSAAIRGPGSWVQWNPASLFRVNAAPPSMNHLRPLKSLNHPRQGVLYDMIRYYTGYTQQQPTTVSAAGKDFFNNAWCAIGRRQVPQEISAGDSGDFEMEGLSCGLVSRW